MTNTELDASLRAIGMTQTDFGGVTGYSKEHVNKMVRGKRDIPRVVELAAVALTLHATMRSRLEVLTQAHAAEDRLVQGYAMALSDVARALEDRRTFTHQMPAPPNP